MEKDLEALLEQIQKEGLEKTQKQTNELKEKAQIESQKIVDEAKLQAKQLLEQAQKEVELTQERFQEEIKLDSRDFLLNIKQELNNLFQLLLQKEIEKEYQHNLGEILLKFLECWIKNQENLSEVEVFLKEQEFLKIQQYLLGQLKQEFQNGIHFKIHPNINSGFRVSASNFLNGYFDFEAKTLSELFITYFSSDLQSLLEDSLNEKD